MNVYSVIGAWDESKNRNIINIGTAVLELYIYIYIYIYVCVCVRVCARACVCVCVRARVWTYKLWKTRMDIIGILFFSVIKILHRPGIEPGPPAWQASILPLNHRCYKNTAHCNYYSLELGNYMTVSSFKLVAYTIVKVACLQLS